MLLLPNTCDATFGSNMNIATPPLVWSRIRRSPLAPVVPGSNVGELVAVTVMVVPVTKIPRVAV